MEQTSNETINDLRSGNRTDPRLVEYLSECLLLADMVKFARAMPGDDIHDECFMAAFNFVEESSRKIVSETVDEAGVTEVDDLEQEGYEEKDTQSRIN